MNTAISLPRSSAILQQLGGRGFILMTGATHILGGEGNELDPNPTLQMVLGEHEAGWHKLRVTLRDNGLYKMEFWKRDGLEMLMAQYAGRLDPADTYEIDGVFGDQLQEIFTHVTGMDTNVPSLIRASDMVRLT